MSEKKLDEEDLINIKNFENLYAQLTAEFGDLEYKISTLRRRQAEISSYFEDIENRRVEMTEALVAKYGAGTIDTNAGIFVAEEATE